MSYLKIRELRKAGKLQEALTLAYEELKRNPGDIYIKGELAWVLYEFIKKYAADRNYDEFKSYLIKIKELCLPAEKALLYEKCAYQIGKIIFSFQKGSPDTYRKLNEIFDIIKEFPFSKPSNGYSFLYKAFQHQEKGWKHYLFFADWWGFDNFLPEDYQLSKSKDGENYPPIAERAFYAYARHLLNSNIPLNRDKILSYLQKLDQIFQNHPEYIFLPLHQFKLCRALGISDQTYSERFLHFTKKKRKDSWVWQYLAELHEDDQELQLACYCKALSLNSPNDKLRKVRLAAAALFIRHQLFNEAKTEILQYVETSKKYGWSIQREVLDWQQQDWYAKAIAKKNNSDFYKKYIPKAEALLFADIPEEIVVVYFVNTDKKVLNFVKNKNNYGFFKYAGHLNDPEVGDILKVKLEKKGNDGFYELLTAKKIEDYSIALQSGLIDIVEGDLIMSHSKNFGFVNGVYVDSRLIKSSGVEDGQEVVVKAILSFDSKKNKVGWKAIEITPKEY